MATLGKLAEAPVSNITQDELDISKLYENLGQYLDIVFKVPLNKGSYEKEAKQEILAKQKLNDLQNEILQFLQRNYSNANFDLPDIKNYFSEFKSPYHSINTNVNASRTVSYTSEHLNRYLSEDDWINKYGPRAQYKDATYVNENKKNAQGQLIKFRIDNKHFGIDLVGRSKDLYLTNLGKIHTFPMTNDTQNNGGLGNVVIIHHVIQKNNNYYPLNIASVYAHLSNISNNNLDGVFDGDKSFGLEGGTGRQGGNTYPSHLHLELWKINDKIATSENLNLSSVRDTKNGLDISYNYRYINSTFESFMDLTDSSNFKFFDDTKIDKPASTGVYRIAPNLFTANTYINGYSASARKGISSFSKSFLKIPEESSTFKYYPLKYDSNENIIFDKYSIENLTISKNSNSNESPGIETFSIEEERELDQQTSRKSFEFKFTDYLDAFKDHININSGARQFGKKLLEFSSSNNNQKTPLFTFYFPIRLKIFKNYPLRGKKSHDINDDIHLNLNKKLKENNFDQNYFIKFEIFEILSIENILNTKYDKLSKKFNIDLINQSIYTEKIKKELSNQDNINKYYKASIVYAEYSTPQRNKSGSDNTNLGEIKFNEISNSKGDFFIINENLNSKQFVNIFKFNSENSLKDTQNQLKIKLSAPKEYQSRLTSASNDNTGILYNFLEKYDIPFLTNMLLPNPDTIEDKIKYNDFSRSYMNFFDEKNDDRDNDISLPSIYFSNEFETINNIGNLYFQSSSLSKSISISASNVDLTDNKKYIDEKLFHPALSLKCKPFVESIFFTHRLESNYLPECIYGNKFIQSQKRGLFNGKTRNNGEYYNYMFPPDYPELAGNDALSLYSIDKYKEIVLREVSTTGDHLYFDDTYQSPVYTFYLNLNDLYFEIIYNMIDIQVFGIED
jgi:hypothetical protein